MKPDFGSDGVVAGVGGFEVSAVTMAKLGADTELVIEEVVVMGVDICKPGMGRAGGAVNITNSQVNLFKH